MDDGRGGFNIEYAHSGGNKWSLITLCWCTYVRDLLKVVLDSTLSA
jgi:hypothetical protein